MDGWDRQIREREVQRMEQNLIIDRVRCIMDLAKIIHVHEGCTFSRAYAAAEMLTGFQKGVTVQTREQQIQDMLTG